MHDFRTMVAALILVAGSAGCASQAARVQRFDAFAQAGSTYAASLDKVLDASFESTVIADSLTLIQNRALLSPADRRKQWTTSTEGLERRRAILADLRHHAGLLRGYFLSLAALANADAESSGLLEVANSLVEGLNAVHGDLAGAQLGGVDLPTVAAAGTQLAVGTFQSKALQRELTRNAQTIDRELQLQKVMLESLAVSMTDDLEIERQQMILDNVLRPFAEEGELPDDWMDLRSASLATDPGLEALQAALTAVGSLRTGFVALVEARFDAGALTLLLGDVQGILDALSATEAEED